MSYVRMNLRLINTVLPEQKGHVFTYNRQPLLFLFLALIGQTDPDLIFFVSVALLVRVVDVYFFDASDPRDHLSYLCTNQAVDV